MPEGNEDRIVSPSVEIRRFVRERLATQTSLKMPELAELAFDQFKNDKGFVEAVLREYCHSTIYSIIQSEVSRTRTNEPTIVVGGKVIKRSDIMKGSISKLLSWWEHSGDRSIKLSAMKRQDLLMAAEEREKRGKTELRIAQVWRELAERLPDDQTELGTVLESMSEDEVQTIGERLGLK